LPEVVGEACAELVEEHHQGHRRWRWGSSGGRWR
jgi:hypothetical protein